MCSDAARELKRATEEVHDQTAGSTRSRMVTNCTPIGPQCMQSQQTDCLKKAADLIARCRYAEMIGLKSDVDSRNKLIHTIFESQDLKARRSLPDMIKEHKISTFDQEMNIEEVYIRLGITSENQKLAMLFIAVVNVCREHVYWHPNIFLNKKKGKLSDTFKADISLLFSEGGLEFGEVLRILENTPDFAYLKSAKQLNQLRNSVTKSVNRGADKDKWKKDINSSIEANEEYENVLERVLESLSEDEAGRVTMALQERELGFSNLAQLFHILWTSFWKIRLGERGRTLNVITDQTILLLKTVPQILHFPEIVVKISSIKRLSWFSNRPGSLAEYFGSDTCPRLLEQLINELNNILVGSEDSFQNQVTR
jgi:hypothetical protein